MDSWEKIHAFLAGSTFAVVGASNNRQKYGNKVFRAYREHNRDVFPINPRETEVEGLPCYPNLASLPGPVHGVSIVTPPAETRNILEEAAAAGVHYVWMQPGAEPNDWQERADRLGLVAIGGGPCVLVVLGFHEEG